MKPVLIVRITVRGHLSDRLATAFDGLTATSGAGTTDLCGEVADQAQLHALLTRVRDLGLALDSVAVATDAPGAVSPRDP